MEKACPLLQSKCPLLPERLRLLSINLVKKAYVKRTRSQKDRRVVLVSLTSTGEKAFYHHKKFHEDMVRATIAGLNLDETEVLVRALSNLCTFFKNYPESAS